ncbi:MAG: EamA family transporter [Pedobacter sp.]
MKAGRLKYFLAAISAVVIWGFFSIPLRKLQHYSSDEILYYRIFTSLVLTWTFIALFRKKQVRSDLVNFYSEDRAGRKKVIAMSLLSGVLISGNWFTYIYAVNNVNLKSAAFAYMVCPLITALGGFLILKEKLSGLKLIALGIASVSILILAQGSLRDVLWSVFVAALYSFFLITQKSMSRMDKFNMLGVQLLIAATLMLPFFIASFKAFPADLYFWTDIVIISIFFTIIPLFLSLYALIGMPSSTLGIIIYLNPIVAFAVAFFYFHEGISLHQLYAYSLLLAAVVVFNWDTIKEIFFKIPDAREPGITP